MRPQCLGLAMPRKDLAPRMEAMHAKAAPKRSRAGTRSWLQRFLVD